MPLPKKILTREILTKTELIRLEKLISNFSNGPSLTRLLFSSKGRAWLRSTLNEHSLERYFHNMLGNKTLLRYVKFLRY